MKTKLISLYALYLIWTGLWASIIAQTLKQNAFWFCSILGVITILGAYFQQVGREILARKIVAATAAIVLCFYLYSFMSDPVTDATYRVGLIIITSIGILMTVTFPSEKKRP